MGGSQVVQYCFSSDNASCRKETRSTAVYVILYFFFISVVMLTVCGNLMVIISISHFKQLHTPTNFLLLSLAVADFLIGLIVMPLAMIRYIETCWYFGKIFCIIFYSILSILTVVSLNNVVFISIDRYVAVCEPLQYSNKITLNVMCLCIIFIWSFSVFYVLMIIIGNINLINFEGVKSCLGECMFTISAPWVIADILVAFILPCSVMICIYIKIFSVAKRHAQMIKTATEQLTYNRSSSKFSKRSERKAAKTLGIVMAVFLMCFLPYYIGSLFEGELNLTSSVTNSLVFVINISSAMNPIIYALFYPWFQKSVKEILKFRICNGASDLINLFPENY